MSTLGQIIGQLTLGAIAGGVLSAVLGEELRTRLNLLPRILIHLAARHLPVDMRADRIEEWNAELRAIAEQTEGLPLTRFLRGLSYALSLFLHTGALTGALTGRSRLTISLAAGRRTLAALTSAAAALEAYAELEAYLSPDPSFSWGGLAACVAYGCLGAGALLYAVWQSAPNADMLPRSAQRLGVAGFSGLALFRGVSVVSTIHDGQSPNGVPVGVDVAISTVLALGFAGLAYILARGIVGPAVLTVYFVLEFSVTLLVNEAHGFNVDWPDAALADYPFVLLLAILIWKYRNRTQQRLIPILSTKSHPRPRHEDASA